MNKETLGEIVRELESDFISGTGTLMSKYVTTDLYEDMNTIYAYLNSKHISGEYDSMEREKPFFNIVIASRNIWFRATDKDRKDIRLRAKKGKDTYGAYLLNILLQDWMAKEKFGTFLNNWGLVQAGFNSAVCKFVEKDGRLVSTVVPWSRLIVDQVNFNSNPKIEILELTEAELYDRGYDKEQVKAMCDSSKARELTNKEKKDNKKGYYKVYEVHGVFPLSYITDKDTDKDTFVQQMQVLSFVAQKKVGRNKQEYDEFVLYRGKEEKDPYMLTSLLPSDDGSISLDGSVKNLFQAQWMTNHTKKAIKDQLDLASKLIFQTSDGNFVGQNALSAIESGDILIHTINQPLTQLANTSHDITALQNFGAEWKSLSSEINGISDAMLGVAPKSGTAWKQTEALLAENHSLFEIMGENKMLALEDMLKERILPFLKKKLDNSEEISALLGDYGVDKIEKRWVKNKGTTNFNQKIKDAMLNSKKLPDITVEGEMEGVRESMSESEMRYIKPSDISSKTWKDLLKDIDVDVEIISEESSNTQEALQTIDKMLSIIINPNYANNEKAQYLVNKGLEMTGYLSSVELLGLPEPVATPTGGKVGAMELSVEQK